MSVFCLGQTEKLHKELIETITLNLSCSWWWHSLQNFSKRMITDFDSLFSQVEAHIIISTDHSNHNMPSHTDQEINMQIFVNSSVYVFQLHIATEEAQSAYVSRTKAGLWV